MRGAAALLVFQILGHCQQAFDHGCGHGCNIQQIFGEPGGTLQGSFHWTPAFLVSRLSGMPIKNPGQDV